MESRNLPALSGDWFRRLNKFIQTQRKSSRMDTIFPAQSGRVKAWFIRPFRLLACASGFFLLFAMPAAAQPQPLVVSTVAGLANFGVADGISSVAKFYFPTGVAVDGAGNVYVADPYNDTIRKITGTGVVTTLAGMAQIAGHQRRDGKRRAIQ